MLQPVRFSESVSDISNPLTRDFITGFMSFGPQNIATRFCKGRCVTAFAKSSSRPAPNWGLHREERVGARSRAYVLIDPAETFVFGCAAANQGSLSAPHPDGIPQAAQALMGKAVLGARLFLRYFWKCDRRLHQPVLGITFLQMMPPASTGGPSLLTINLQFKLDREKGRNVHSTL